MKIVVIGGSGLIGTRVVAKLAEQGHQAVAASPRTGVNALTGEGLQQALNHAEVVVDVANSPSFEPAAVLDFFERSGRNLLAAEAAAGVKHHVALSIVALERSPGNGYFRAKVAQEKLIRESGIPYTIVRATQFFEFIGAIAESGAVDGKVVVPTAQFQPIAAADVADAVARAALAPPVNGIVEIAGPDRAPFNDFVAKRLKAAGDGRAVIGDAKAGYFGAPIDDRSLTPEGKAQLGPTGFDAWLAETSVRPA